LKNKIKKLNLFEDLEEDPNLNKNIDNDPEPEHINLNEENYEKNNIYEFKKSLKRKRN